MSRRSIRRPTHRAPSSSAVVAVLIAFCLVLAGCSGVPHSSRPEIVRPVNNTSPSVSVGQAPSAGDDPRAIVQGFLFDAVYPEAKHSLSRQYLAPDAANKWQDNPVTVVDDDNFSVGVTTAGGDAAQVEVQYRQVGEISAAGIFTPETAGTGVGKASTAVYTTRKVNGQWRIDSLPNGVFIRSTSFATRYLDRPLPLYFFDSTGTRLVPDIRYSALAEDEPVAQWLFTQLLAGPRPELQAAVQSEIPDSVDPKRAAVKLSGDVVEVELPGSSQLDSASRARLAIQLAFTFSTLAFGSAKLTLTDGGKPVTIPGAGTVFSASPDFTSYSPDNSATGAQQYYLRTGGLYSGLDNRPVSGPVGAGAYALTSLAVRRSGVAAVTVVGVDTSRRLMLGAASGPLIPVAVPSSGGSLSLPEFRPYTSSANPWVASGTTIYSIDAARVAHVVSTPASLSGGGLPKGEIETLRFSPEGARLAVVVKSAVDGTQALYIGSVVTTTNNVTSIEDFKAITPASVEVQDIAWKDATTLLMIANSGSSTRLQSVVSDGSQLRTLQAVNLPPGLSRVAAAIGQPAVVSAGPQGHLTLWVDRGPSWAPVSGSDQTSAGDAPAYAP
ncbi:LpqB family beta-propeller domain-containing protein [Jatrophihabitans telluris]|uniref:LpqB family beta-propeller domain-containing protein n=1 Tax=Jatrophihabitans telluris TaxID=2038343 RepID=A0ABY4QW99_9ACTN|nr:LpqB family beta-propeller domain-containing protein [Jatrophihabitans telluris]UQX87527.1 LpqB family beta-propeller domain-containing protein [Jatrophihabitans telluris]